MNPLILFDHIYFTIGYVYANILRDEFLSEFAGVLFLSMFQAFNIIAIVGFTYKSLNEFEPLNPFWIILFAYIPMLIFNIVRYKKFAIYDQLEVKWENTGKRKKTIIKVWVILYFILSMIVFVYSGNTPK